MKRINGHDIILVQWLRKALFGLFLLFPANALLHAQDTFNTDKSGQYSDQYLDTVKVSKTKVINDYSMIGVQGGMGMNFVLWQNPNRNQQARISPYNFGIFYTRYGKMFGYMPYFGFQAGVIYSQEGYKFKQSERGYTETLEGATEASMEVIEVPLYGQLHVDFWKMKMIANLGCYGGYRLSINRIGDDVPEDRKTSFLPTDRRLDYGVKAGAGFGFVFDPVEIHLQAMYKQSLSSLYDPTAGGGSSGQNSYAFPANVQFSIGVFYHITNRLGKTTKVMKEEAREIVRSNRKKEKDENKNSESR